MRATVHLPTRAVLLAIIFCVLWFVPDVPLPNFLNILVITGGILLTFPLTWWARRILDKQPTFDRAVWITTFLHFGLGFTLGIPFIRAITTHDRWPGWLLPVPSGVGFALVLVTGAACLLTVINLALRGLGAPFFISLSRKLAADWLYAWTRNPMVLAVLAWFISIGIWFQSALFVCWVIIFFAPALLFFVKVYEERELEIRFGASYLEYKARTPMLLPRRPRH
ncbi:MAG TPA: isoprenylcysteine carboxylmethyltransferase family protein [Bacteroidota bacterium]|nr:isoprenylcysteine carboxylmethyltransferase family protein [Bacteroidota bacterium]